MLKIVKGDLFAHAIGPCIIAHGCNAQGVMGSGFALAIKERFPWAYEGYRLQFRTKGLKRGAAYMCHRSPDTIIIANCITQADYGRDPNIHYVSYESVADSLALVAEYAAHIYPAGPLPIHFPFIGGGLANGDRDILMSIFEKAFLDSDATLYIQ